MKPYFYITLLALSLLASCTPSADQGTKKKRISSENSITDNNDNKSTSPPESQDQITITPPTNSSTTPNQTSSSNPSSTQTSSSNPSSTQTSPSSGIALVASKFSPSYNSTLPNGDTAVMIKFETTLNASCKLINAMIPSHPETPIKITGGTSHYHELSGLKLDESYSYEVKCFGVTQADKDKSSISVVSFKTKSAFAQAGNINSGATPPPNETSSSNGNNNNINRSDIIQTSDGRKFNSFDMLNVVQRNITQQSGRILLSLTFDKKSECRYFNINEGAVNFSNGVLKDYPFPEYEKLQRISSSDDLNFSYTIPHNYQSFIECRKKEALDRIGYYEHFQALVNGTVSFVKSSNAKFIKSNIKNGWQLYDISQVQGNRDSLVFYNNRITDSMAVFKPENTNHYLCYYSYDGEKYDVISIDAGKYQKYSVQFIDKYQGIYFIPDKSMYTNGKLDVQIFCADIYSLRITNKWNFTLNPTDISSEQLDDIFNPFHTKFYSAYSNLNSTIAINTSNDAECFYSKQMNSPLYFQSLTSSVTQQAATLIALGGGGYSADPIMDGDNLPEKARFNSFQKFDYSNGRNHIVYIKDFFSTGNFLVKCKKPGTQKFYPMKLFSFQSSDSSQPFSLTYSSGTNVINDARNGNEILHKTAIVSISKLYKESQANWSIDLKFDANTGCVLQDATSGVIFNQNDNVLIPKESKDFKIKLNKEFAKGSFVNVELICAKTETIKPLWDGKLPLYPSAINSLAQLGIHPIRLSFVVD